MKKIILASAAAAALTFPVAAQAQDAGAETFVGVAVGYHDLGADDIADDFGIEIEDSSVTLGVFAGADFAIGSGAFAGVEANYNFGFDAIDSEYGASARLGFRDAGGAKYYVRGGYQWVDLDVAKITGLDESDVEGVDDTGGDYLVGAGVEFPVGGAALRVNLDTVAFDTLRATAGVAMKF